MSGPLSAADLATLSLLDPDQGVCPNDHPCRLDDLVGYRQCANCGYVGLALICWGIAIEQIDRAARDGADVQIVSWAKSFVMDRDERTSN
jgi:hypothetical protein